MRLRIHSVYRLRCMVTSAGDIHYVYVNAYGNNCVLVHTISCAGVPGVIPACPSPSVGPMGRPLDLLLII
jgi:hypothetical protein